MANKQFQKKRAPASRYVLVVGTFVLLAAGVVLLTQNADQQPADAARESAESAPDVTLEFFDGSSQQLSDLTGKPVVLNFWASWCPACISEMPDFGEVHRRLGDQVEFIGVNMQEVDIDAANRLVEQTNVDYRLAHDRDGAIYNQFGGISMPTTVFISADGTVAEVHSGTIFEDELTETIETELLQ
ncbi:MAG: TlpA family protein disulfide reductase [Actinomycetota bacterium]